MSIRRRRLFSVLAAVGLALLFGSADVQASLLVSQSSGDLGYGYGFNRWDNFSGEIDAAFGNDVTVVSGFDNLAQMLLHDSLLLDQRWTTGSLSLTEAANIATFAATGRRVLLMGENNSWTAWNNQILGIVGGTYAGEFAGSTSRLVVNEITAGAPTLDLPFAGTAGLGGGGTALYDSNFATLWGANQNVLTVLDINVWDDDYWDVENGGVFGANVAAWLAVPEPGTASLLGFGLIGLAAFRRR